MSDHEWVVRRVRKLLALSRSPNVHEAESAATKAQELIARHKLDRAAIETRTVESDIDLESFDYAGKVVPWKRDLAFAVGRGCFCQAIHTPRGDGTGGRSWLH